MLNITQRELIVKLRSQRKKQNEIAAIVGCSQPTVNYWLNRVGKNQSLETMPRSGRPTPLTEETVVQLKTEFEDKAREANKKFCSITTKQFSEMITTRTKIKFSPRHCRRILHKLNFSRITPRSQHIKNDPAKVAEFREQFKKNSKQSIWIMNL